MKKLWFLSAFLFALLLLAWCNVNLGSEYDLQDELGRLQSCADKVGSVLSIDNYEIGWDEESEGGASFIMNWHVSYESDWIAIEKDIQCVIDMVDKSVSIQEVSYEMDEYPWEIEDLYWTYKLVSFNNEVTDISATLTISEKLIWAKFCNDMWSDDYSIRDNYIHVNNMSQTEMFCDSEKLMESESKFDLSNAKISLVERNLRLTTSNWDIYDFFKNVEEQPVAQETNYEVDYGTSELYSKEDMDSAIAAIMNEFNNEWQVKCEMHKIYYAGDEISQKELPHVQLSSIAPFTESLVMYSDFHSPVNPEEAGAFDPDQEYRNYNWILWREEGGEWIVVDRWY